MLLLLLRMIVKLMCMYVFLDIDAGKYYAQSIVNATCMKAVQCDNLQDFNNYLCSANDIICTGENVPLK